MYNYICSTGTRHSTASIYVHGVLQLHASAQLPWCLTCRYVVQQRLSMPSVMWPP